MNISCTWLAILLVISLQPHGASLLNAASGDEFWDAGIGSPGVGGYQVDAIAVGKDGVYIGGTFWRVGSVATTNLAKWDGRHWSAVGGGIGTGLSDGVGALLNTQGNLYVGGLFDKAGSVNATNVARWDGDKWWSLGLGISGVVRALATSDGSNIYVGGSFKNAGGIAATNVAFWDGSHWSSLGGGITGSAGAGMGAVDAIAIGGDGVYVGGSITNAGGVRVQNIARWDGSTWWPLGAGITGRVRTLAVWGRALYAGGTFTRAGNVYTTNIAKWNGTDWESMGGGVTHDESISSAGTVGALAIGGNDLYVSGSFLRVGGVFASRIAKWDGRRWSALGIGIGGSPVGGDGRGVSELACTGGGAFRGRILPVGG